MTTTSTPTVPARRPGGLLRSPAGRTATHLLAGQLVVAAWFWPIVVLIGVAMDIAFARSGTPRSMWSTLVTPPSWFLFVMAIMMTTSYVAPHVSTGRTRRSFLVAVLASGTVTAVLSGVLWVVLRLVEHAVLTRTGVEVPGTWAEPGAIGAMLVAVGLTFLVFTASGVLVGATYYRWNGWLATLALPLTVGPVLLTEPLLRPHQPGTLLTDDLPLAAGAAGAVVLALLLAGAAHLVLRDAPIRTRQV